MIFDWYLEHEFAFAAAQLALAMFGMGAKLTPQDFAAEFRSPRPFLTGMAIQLITVPLIAVAVSKLLGVSPGIATGLILVAAVPGGTISNVITYVGRGNIALSIALTAVTTVGCLVTTPAILQLFASASLPEAFEMPTRQIAFDIALCLLAPLAFGMFVGARFPGWRDLIAQRAIQLSIFVIVLMIIGASGAGRVDPMEQGVSAILGIVLLALSAQIVALVVTRATRVADADQIAIAVEVTVRNTNLALMIKASLFPVIPGVADPFADGVLYIALMYGGIALPVVAPLVSTHRRRNHPNPREKTPSAAEPGGG